MSTASAVAPITRDQVFEAMPASIPLSEDAKTALFTFVQRFGENRGKQKVDNSSLREGSPMYYYCRGCDEHIATMYEGHTEPAPSKCEPCKYLEKLGLLQPIRAFCLGKMAG